MSDSKCIFILILVTNLLTWGVLWNTRVIMENQEPSVRLPGSAEIGKHAETGNPVLMVKNQRGQTIIYAEFTKEGSFIEETSWTSVTDGWRDPWRPEKE